jgi:hypothetical protein
MPLLDHFHAPLFPSRHWESFHVNWAGAIADALNERLLPAGYFAEEHAQIGPRVEIDVATFTEPDTSSDPGRNGGTLVLPPRTWAPPPPALVIPAAYPDRFEVLIFESEGGARLVAAIELISPANKDRATHRQAFAIKCASYLVQSISLMIVDIVTSGQADLHQEVMHLLGHGEATALPPETPLYAVAYRPLVRDQAGQIEIWPAPLAVGQALPVLPLALNAETCLPLDLEATYLAACQRRRLL